MALPLILLITMLVAYPAGYAATSPRSKQGHDQRRRARQISNSCSGAIPSGWVVFQSACSRITAVISRRSKFGFVAAIVHKFRGAQCRHAARSLGHPPAIEHARLAVAVRPLLLGLQLDPGACRPSTASPGLGETGWGALLRHLVNVGSARPFFMIMYLAALNPSRQLYEAASIDGATCGSESGTLQHCR